MDSYWFGIIGILATIAGVVAGLFYGRRQNQELTSKVEHLTKALATTRKQERQVLQKTIMSLASVQMDIQKLAEKPKFSAASGGCPDLSWRFGYS